MEYRFLRFPEGKFKAVTLSYDDGLRADIKLAEIAGRYGMKCTFNVCSGLISEQDGQHYLSASEIKNHLLIAGHEVAVHGHMHKAPGLLTPTECVAEIMDCRRNLEREFGRIINGMAYPDSGIRVITSGTSCETIYGILRSLGIVYARTTEDDQSFSLPEDWYNWKPTVHNTDPKVLEYAEEFLKLDEKKLYVSRRWPKLFYMWGHSPEFDRFENWELLDELGKRFSESADIWFATNMEIYEYVTAYNSLVFNTTGDVVYNPTVIKVWFDYNGKIYSVEPGETKIIT